MTEWSEFAAALAVFFGSHAALARPSLRGRLIGRLGPRLHLVAYSAVSTALFVWTIWAAARAPYVELWAPAPWRAYAPNLAMPIAILLATLGVGAPNPLSFGGARNEAYDPFRPGVAGWARHPILWATALWSGAHLVPNGDLAHVILFGASLGFSLLGMRALDARARRRLGPEEWERLARLTSGYPGQAWLDGRRPSYGAPPWRRLALAAAVYAVLILAHRPAMGVSPLPV